MPHAGRRVHDAEWSHLAPGPINCGVEIDSAVVDGQARSRRQVTFGIAVLHEPRAHRAVRSCSARQPRLRASAYPISADGQFGLKSATTRSITVAV